VGTLAGLCVLSTRLYNRQALTSASQVEEVVIARTAVLGPLTDPTAG
jgi:hypothetical protein